MKFAKIYLVRHGGVENPKNIIYGYLPLPLSKEGEREAKKAGLFLKKKNIAVIFSSPQRRTQQTAKIIKKVIRSSKKIITDKDLREAGFGHFVEGLTQREVCEKYPKQWSIYNRQPAKAKTGESLAHIAQRMIKAINKGIKKYPGQNLVFVTHRDPILAALLKISKRSFDDLHQVKYLCPTGSVLEIDLIGRKLVNKSF